MKKIYLISTITIIIGLLIAVKPDWFKFLWGWQMLLLPLTAGILMVLVQNEDRSYRYAPKLLIGSVLTSFIYTFLWQLIEYDYDGYFLFLPVLQIALFFVIVCIFGGLIGLVIRGTSEQFKKHPNSIIILAFRKIFGSLFISIGVLGVTASSVVFLVLFFNPSSPWLNTVMVDFKLIDVVGVILYYLLLLSFLSVVLIPLIFVIILGLMLFFPKKKVFDKKLFSRLIIYFFISLVIFLLLSSYTDSKFELKKAEMKKNNTEEHFDIKDFNNIYVSRFVKFDEIKIIQGDKFDIAVKGSQYDQIGLDFEKINDKTLAIKRSELETYYNTETWTMENEDSLFPAGTKHLVIEIIMPDIEKIILDGGRIELVDFDVDNIDIELNKRFTDIKGNITVEDTLKLNAKGGVINLSGSAKNLIIDSGDCWIEMDKFVAENATINAVNTSRLNVYVTDNMEVLSGKNSGIVNYFDNK